jgi:hypothetical protein
MEARTWSGGSRFSPPPGAPSGLIRVGEITQGKPGLSFLGRFGRLFGLKLDSDFGYNAIFYLTLCGGSNSAEAGTFLSGSSLPPLMDELADLLIVKTGQHGHLVRCQWRQVRRHDVLCHLLLVPGSGNHAGHCRMIENPSKGQVSHAHSFGKDPPDFLHGLKRRFEIDP